LNKNGISTIGTSTPDKSFYKGGTPSRGNTEDLMHGINGNGATGDIKLADRSQSQLWDEMNDLISDFATGSALPGGLEAVGLNMVEYFDSNTNVNNNYINSQLSQAVLESKEMRNFAKKYGAKLNQQFKNNGFGFNGNIPMLQDERPVFNSYHHSVTGLTICMNDTEETRVYRYNLVSNETTKEW
jgi:hypothetical protein